MLTSSTSSKQSQDERQPLLDDNAEDDNKHNAQGIPWLPILILATWRAAHAIYFGYILTWITRFIILNKLADQTSVGRVAGWIEAAYSLGILLGLAPAAYLSDTLGRKPTAITGIVFASIGTILFGFAGSILQLVALRLFNGFFIAFLPATILTSFIELATPETMALVFTINTVAWRLGMIIAPFIGGVLAEPATYYPGVFEGTIWDRYPYALSGVVAASMPLLAVAVGIFIVPETLPKHRKKSVWSIFKRRASTQAAEAETAATRAPLRGLFTKRLCYMLWLWFFYVTMQMTCYVAEVLFLSSSRTVGGLDLIPREMAIFYIVRPLVSAAVNILVYPTLARRFSPEDIFKWGVTLNNTTFYASYLAFGLYAATHDVPHRVTLGILLILSIPIGLNGSTSTACTQALSSRAPSKAYLARVLTAQEYVANSGVGLGSLLGSNAWALGVTYQLLHGQAVWLAVLLLAIVLAGMAARLTKEKSDCDAEEGDEEVVSARDP